MAVCTMTETSLSHPRSLIIAQRLWHFWYHSGDRLLASWYWHDGMVLGVHKVASGSFSFSLNLTFFSVVLRKHRSCTECLLTRTPNTRTECPLFLRRAGTMFRIVSFALYIGSRSVSERRQAPGSQEWRCYCSRHPLQHSRNASLPSVCCEAAWLPRHECAIFTDSPKLDYSLPTTAALPHKFGHSRLFGRKLSHVPSREGTHSKFPR